MVKWLPGRWYKPGEEPDEPPQEEKELEETTEAFKGFDIGHVTVHESVITDFQVRGMVLIGCL
jgi:hypothetical protein